MTRITDVSGDLLTLTEGSGWLFKSPLGGALCWPHNGGAENTGVENAGVENAGVDRRGGKCRSDNVWKGEI